MLKRILITGAGGFVGTHLRTELARALPDATIIAGRADMRDVAAIDAMVSDAAPDGCVHLAAVSTVTQAASDQDIAWTVNLNGTLHVARALQARAPKCRLIFASSAEVYGDSFRSGVPLNEDAVLAPNTFYGVTKAAADLALGVMARAGLDVVRLRLFNHTGPGQSAGFVVSAFARQLAAIRLGEQEPVIKVGALDHARDFLDVRDVCRAYVAALTGETIAPGTILNIASSTPRRVGDVLEQLRRIADTDVTWESDPARLRTSDIPFACGDATRAHQMLAWSPVVPWGQTLADLLDYWERRLGEVRGRKPS